MAESICQHITLTYTTEMLENNDYTLYHYALKAIVQAIIDTKTGWIPDPEFLDMSTGEYNPAYESNPSVEDNKYSCINLSHNSGHKIQLCCGSQIPCSEEYHFNIYNLSDRTSPQTTLQGFTITYINNKTDKTLNASSIEEGSETATITKNQDFYSLELGCPLYSFAEIYVVCSYDGNQITIIFANNLITNGSDYPLYYRGLVAGEICKPIIYPSGDFHPLTNIAYTVLQPEQLGTGYGSNEYCAATSILIDKQETFISGKKHIDTTIYFQNKLVPLNVGAAWDTFNTAICEVVTIKDVPKTIISSGMFCIGGSDTQQFKVVEGSGIKGYLNTDYLGFCYNYTLPNEENLILSDGYILNNGEYIYINKMALNWSNKNTQDKNPFYYRNLLHTEILNINQFRANDYGYHPYDVSENTPKEFWPTIYKDIYLTIYKPTEGQVINLGKGTWIRENEHVRTFCMWPNLHGVLTDYVEGTLLLSFILDDGVENFQAQMQCQIWSTDWQSSDWKLYVSYEENKSAYSWHIKDLGFSHNFGHDYTATAYNTEFTNFGCLLQDGSTAITFSLDDLEEEIDPYKPIMINNDGNHIISVYPWDFNVEENYMFMNTEWMGSDLYKNTSETYYTNYAWIDRGLQVAISRLTSTGKYYIFIGKDSPFAQSESPDLVINFNIDAEWKQD